MSSKPGVRASYVVELFAIYARGAKAALPVDRRHDRGLEVSASALEADICGGRRIDRASVDRLSPCDRYRAGKRVELRAGRLNA